MRWFESIDRLQAMMSCATACPGNTEEVNFAVIGPSVTDEYHQIVARYENYSKRNMLPCKILIDDEVEPEILEADSKLGQAVDSFVEDDETVRKVLESSDKLSQVEVPTPDTPAEQADRRERSISWPSQNLEEGGFLDDLARTSRMSANVWDLSRMSEISYEQLGSDFKIPRDSDLLQVSASIYSMAGLPCLDTSRQFPGNARSAFMALHAFGRIVVARNLMMEFATFGQLIGEFGRSMTPIAIEHGSGNFTWAPKSDVVLGECDRLVLMSFTPLVLAEGLFMNHDLERKPVNNVRRELHGNDPTHCDGTPWPMKPSTRTAQSKSKSRRCCGA